MLCELMLTVALSPRIRSQLAAFMTFVTQSDQSKVAGQ